MTRDSSLPKAIIDTSVLLSLYALDLLRFLDFFYSEVRVPTEVEREFLENHKEEREKSARLDFLTGFYDTYGYWFIKCNEYRSDTIKIYLAEKNIDRGEAEIFAQNQSLGDGYELLLDEKVARNLAKNKNVKVHGVLYILARLDLRFRACEYYTSVKQLKTLSIGRFADNIVKLVYEEERSNL